MIGITLGLGASPFVGSFLYRSFGYLGPFVFIFLLSIPPLFLPSALKGIHFNNDEDHHSYSLVKTVLKNRRALLMNIYTMVASLFLSSLETCLSDHLMTKFNFSPDIVGLYFTLYFGGRVLLSLLFLCLPS